MDFVGTYEHTIDDRGRIAVPARYRDAFRDGGMFARSPDGCVELYTQADYERKAAAVRSEPDHLKAGRRVRRGFFASSFPAEIDRQGRILLPQALRQWGGLNGAVTIIGRGECLEIWNPERYEDEAGDVEREYGPNLESLPGGREA